MAKPMTEQGAAPPKGRLVFMGSPEFALPSLKALLEAGFEVPLVLSQPDRRAGRGRKNRATAVAAFAREQGLPLLTPGSLEDPGVAQHLREVDARWFVVVAYSLLPEEILAIAQEGAVNLHASLLPDFRGAAPIQRAIMKGESRSGLSTFLLEAGVDAGPILLQKTLAVGPNETAGSLHDRMMVEGAELLKETMLGLAGDALKPQPQIINGTIRRAPKLSNRTRILHFERSAQHLHDRIRALSPFPGTRCMFREQSIQLLESRVLKQSVPAAAAAGEILGWDDQGLRIATGQDQLVIRVLKPEGRRAMSIKDWINGNNPRTGEKFVEEKHQK